MVSASMDVNEHTLMLRPMPFGRCSLSISLYSLPVLLDVVNAFGAGICEMDHDEEQTEKVSWKLEIFLTM